MVLTNRNSGLASVITLSLVVVLMCPSQAAQADLDNRIERLLLEVDHDLAAHVEKEFRAWAASVSQSIHGVLRSLRRQTQHDRDYAYEELVEPGGLKLDMKHGCAVLEAATLFRAYESSR